MELRFDLSGTTLFSVETSSVPPIGSVVQFRTQTYKSGLPAGSLITVKVSAENPPHFDFSQGGDGVVYFDADGYEILEKGPPPQE